MPTPVRSLSIRLLGPFEVSIGGIPVDPGRWQRRKTRHLVKLLALQPHRQLHREEVQDLLWPEVDTTQAAASLRKVIHDARHGLEPRLRHGARSRFIRADGEHVRLSAPGGVIVDVAEFERQAAAALRDDDTLACEAALSLYRGDLLDEDPYEDWCVARREHARQLWRKLVLAVVRHSEARGELAVAIEALDRLVGRDSADEEAHMALMRLQAAAGNSGAVLQQFRQCEEALRRELDCEPSPEMRALFDELRHGERHRPPSPHTNAGPHIGAHADTKVAASISPATSFPRFTTTFVGRQTALADVVERLAAIRFVTLTGPGGSGKTRLAVEVCRVSNAHQDTVWFVDLSVLLDPAMVIKAVAAAVGVGEQPEISLEAALLGSLRDREGLLVLDNCEHLLDGCAALAGAIVRDCAAIRLLATSREPLGLDGETVLPVQPLKRPDPGAPTASIVASESVRLFADRARLVNPRWSLTDANANAVASLCRELDGMPLAIELAAAHVRAMSIAEIVARLDQRFRMLRSGRRFVSERHKTLRATMDWSYVLLLESERLMLRRVSVFSGGWTIDGAEVVCAGHGLDEEAVLMQLERLVDKSLVYLDQSGEVARYRMLETVRAYAVEKLAKSGEEARVRGRHLDWIRRLATIAREASTTTHPDRYLNTLETELENVRAALAWSARGEGVDLLGLAGDLGAFWERRGHWTEGRVWVGRGLAAAPDAPPELRARALNSAGTLARRQSEFEASIQFFERACRIRRAIEDPSLGVSLQGLGNSLAMIRQYDRAQLILEESRAVFERHGDELGAALSLSGLALVARGLGDVAKGRALYEQCFLKLRALGESLNAGIMAFNIANLAVDEGEFDLARSYAEESLRLADEARDDALSGYAAMMLGLVAVYNGQSDVAAEWYRKALTLARDLGDRVLLAFTVEGLSGVAMARGSYEHALRLSGAATTIRAAIPFPREARDTANAERLVREARDLIGEGPTMRALELGASLTLKEVIAIGLET